MRGQLVGREALAEELQHAVDVERRVGLDDGVDALAEVVVGQADHRARAHVGVLLQRGLDLGGVDVGAAAQDHVGEPVAEVEEAVVVEPADVAERLPAALAGAGLGADVAVAGRVARGGAQPHLALLARRQLVAVVVGDEHAALGRLARPSRGARATRRR